MRTNVHSHNGITINAKYRENVTESLGFSNDIVNAFVKIHITQKDDIQKTDSQMRSVSVLF